jgi:hypothetical protein
VDDLPDCRQPLLPPLLAFREGVGQVMIYDGYGQLRIQALGQTLHAL